MKTNITFKYIDKDGALRNVSLDSIISNIGFEYSIPDDVNDLTEAEEIIEVFRDGSVAFSKEQSYEVRKLCRDFYLWMQENDYEHNIPIRVENKVELFLREKGVRKKKKPRQLVPGSN